jgi:release factor glutamine methyltransferase
MKNVKDVVALSAAYLNAKGLPTARLDAEKLIGSVLGLDRLELYLHHDRPVTPAELDAIRPLLRRRADLEPVAYILGEVGFHRLVLKTDARALMPRSETETLVEVALANLPKGGTLLDVGTGRRWTSRSMRLCSRARTPSGSAWRSSCSSPTSPRR